MGKIAWSGLRGESIATNIELLLVSIYTLYTDKYFTQDS